MHIIIAFIAYIIGSQICLADIKSLSGKYVFKPSYTQYKSLWMAIIAVIGFAVECFFLQPFVLALMELLLSAAVIVVFEWILARVNVSNYYVAQSLRVAFIFVSAVYLFQSFSAYLLMGLFFANSPFGIVFSSHPHIGSSRKHVSPSIDVQSMIDEVGRNGGGVVHIPAGSYRISGFLQINHSNVTLEGETDADGNPLTELVCCTNLVNGKLNPWISPFFITTGETIQPSNIFWGLDFRKKKPVRMESSSLSDPGSDGRILTPFFATKVISDAAKDDILLKVEDASKVGKYILVGLYNTSSDGNLIKDILGVSELRPEWLVANRAGDEEAPSYQWLAEVRTVVDEHTIELSSPLLRDIQMVYTPEVYNVEMLENITVRNIILSSEWNGLFHHHGLPLYYSVSQAQEMDYGWNGINFKRVAHGRIENVVLHNFTNPLYVMDSRENTFEHIVVSGYAGHQGLKLYCHSCNNEFSDITFKTHFADMMGGEGNAYGNLFNNIRYVNRHFMPVDFDFHGFSEGPMSPPSHNVFRNVSGFRYIKGAGAMSHIPSCGRCNEWHDIEWEGGRTGDDNRFYMMPYRRKGMVLKYITAFGYSLVIILKRRRFSLSFLFCTFRDKIASIDRMGYDRKSHSQFFPDNRIYN